MSWAEELLKCVVTPPFRPLHDGWRELQDPREVVRAARTLRESRLRAAESASSRVPVDAQRQADALSSAKIRRWAFCNGGFLAECDNLLETKFREPSRGAVDGTMKLAEAVSKVANAGAHLEVALARALEPRSSDELREALGQVKEWGEALRKEVEEASSVVTRAIAPVNLEQIRRELLPVHARFVRIRDVVLRTDVKFPQPALAAADRPEGVRALLLSTAEKGREAVSVRTVSRVAEALREAKVERCRS